jgi:two-component system, OmpR family, sensor histidine kinase KdpD
VRVVDRGPGVPAAEKARIFEPFYRAADGGRVGGPDSENGHRGSGLGLAIVRGFVEANGGKVWVESLPGQGSTFVVELPLEPA